jgi:DNA modification methylase
VADGATTRSWHKPPAGWKSKDLVGIPWRVAFALHAAGWYLRSDIIWSKPNPMPEPVNDRPTKSHEYIFLLSKRESYFYDADAIREPLQPKTLTTYHSERSKGNDALGGVKSDNWSKDVPTRRAKIDENGDPVGANKRTVWTVATQPYDGAHFATFPTRLIEPCVLAGSRPGDLVLDPFFGSGTVGEVAEKHGRRWIGFDLNPAYAELQAERTAQRSLLGRLR